MSDNMNVTVDVGENVSNALEQLARQLGTTIDKIYPWYVQQQVIDGWCSVVLFAIGIIVVPSISIYCFRVIAARWGEDTPQFFAAVVTFLVSVILSVIFVVAASSSLNEIVGKINNPNYFATKAIIADVARLTK